MKLPAMAARSPKGERRMTEGFIVVRWRSTGPPAVTTRPPCDRRRDIGGASADNFVICRENRPVAEQSPGGGHQATARVTLRHCSRSRKSADELPISQNRHPAKNRAGIAGFMFSWDVGFIQEYSPVCFSSLSI